MRRKAITTGRKVTKLYYNSKKPVKPTGRKLYTDEEREKIKKLRTEKTKLSRQYKKLIKASTVTFKSIRHLISDDLARELYYAGYFDPVNFDDYCNRDFRQWMQDNNDNGLLDTVTNEVETLAPELLTEVDPEADKLNKDIADINKQLDDIRLNAKERKELEKAKYEAEKAQNKQDQENALNLLDRIDQGQGVINALTNGEQTAINYLKRKLAGQLVQNLDFSQLNLSPDETAKLKSALYTTIAYNPKEGIRDYIRSSIRDEVIKKYGNDAGEVADSLVNLATGKGDLKFVGLSLFKGVVNKSGFNRSLMNERAQELIDAGESTPEAEDNKMLARDVVFDIAKDVIKSGGNVYAAIPMILKDTFLDVGLHTAKNTFKKK